MIQVAQDNGSIGIGNAIRGTTPPTPPPVVDTGTSSPGPGGPVSGETPTFPISRIPGLTTPPTPPPVVSPAQDTGGSATFGGNPPSGEDTGSATFGGNPPSGEDPVTGVEGVITTHPIGGGIISRILGGHPPQRIQPIDLTGGGGLEDLGGPNDTPPGLVTDPVSSVAGPTDPNGPGGPITTLPVLQAPEQGVNPPTPPAVVPTPDPSTSTVLPPPAAQNTEGAGLAGNGPLIDSLTSMFGGGPTPAQGSSPSTAAIEALQPTAAQTATSSPIGLYLIGAVAIAAAFWFFTRKKAHEHHA